MAKRLSFFLIFSFLVANVAAQEIEMNRYHGKTDQLEISILIQKIDSKIAAQVFYRLVNSNQTDTVGFVELKGETGKDGSLVLKTLDEETVMFNGTKNENRLQGSFKILPGMDAQITCEREAVTQIQGLTELYRNASLKLLPHDPQSPEALIEVTLVVPDDSLSVEHQYFSDFYALVDDSLKTLGFGEQVVHTMEDFFAQYVKLSDFEGEKGPSFQWFKSFEGKIVWMNDRFVNLRKQIYVFTGGANGMFHVSFGLFENETGKQIALNQLFGDGFDEPITQLLTSTLKTKVGCSLDEDLKDFGYFVSEVSPTENFFVSPFGIFFQYNYYELGPRTYGVTAIFLPFDALKPYLKKEVYDNFVVEK